MYLWHAVARLMIIQKCHVNDADTNMNVGRIMYVPYLFSSVHIYALISQYTLSYYVWGDPKIVQTPKIIQNHNFLK